MNDLLNKEMFLSLLKIAISRVFGKKYWDTELVLKIIRYKC